MMWQLLQNSLRLVTSTLTTEKTTNPTTSRSGHRHRLWGPPATRRPFASMGRTLFTPCPEHPPCHDELPLMLRFCSRIDLGFTLLPCVFPNLGIRTRSPF